MGVPEGKVTEKVAEKKVEETMAPSSPNSMKNINLPAQETQQTPLLINTQTHQSQTAESNKRKRIYLHRQAVQLTADISQKQVPRRQWNNSQPESHVLNHSSKMR